MFGFVKWVKTSVMSHHNQLIKQRLILMDILVNEGEKFVVFVRSNGMDFMWQCLFLIYLFLL